MNTSKLLLAAAITVLVGASSSVGAAASTTTAPLTVQITVTKNCTIDTTAGAGLLNFGTQTGGANVLAATGSSGFTVQCTDTTGYAIAMSPTGGSTTGTGNMTNGTTTDTVAFALWQNAGHTTVWGNTAGTNDLSATGDGTAQAYTVFGTVTGASPASGYVKPVVYQNATTITVTY